MLSGHDDPHSTPGGGENEDSSDPTQILCPHCAASNPPQADFCARCGAPLSVIASTDPLRGTLSEGFLYRGATRGPAKLIVVIGVWLIFLPGVSSLLIALGYGVSDPRELAKQGAWSLVSAIIPILATVNYLRKRRAPDPLADDLPDPAA